jgi:iron only hydrogenase large subunit-like protein
MGSLVKSFLCQHLSIPDPSQMYHVSIMPCYDKKLEASRSDFYDDVYRTRDVDAVITTGEVERILRDHGADLPSLPEDELPTLFTKATPDTQALLSTEGSSSGGYLSYIFRYAAFELFGVSLTPADTELGSVEKGVEIRPGRNPDYFELVLNMGGTDVLRFAAAYGFRNIQNVVRKVKTKDSAGGGNGGGVIRRAAGGRSSRPGSAGTGGANTAGDCHFVEVMACPSGCINGGGQLKPLELENIGVSTPAPKSFVAQTEGIYRGKEWPWQGPEMNVQVLELYS